MSLRHRLPWISLLALLIASAAALSQTSRPDGPATTRAASQPSPDEVLGEMLKPRRTTGERELVPTEPPAQDRKSGKGSVKPSAPPVTVMREGTPVVNRVGRLTPGTDGGLPEFAFESDGGALRDPPLLLLPNLKVMIMEDTVRATNTDPRFRVSGVVTEYRGRNYLLLDKVTVISAATQQFK